MTGVLRKGETSTQTRTCTEERWQEEMKGTDSRVKMKAKGRVTCPQFKESQRLLAKGLHLHEAWRGLCASVGTGPY